MSQLMRSNTYAQCNPLNSSRRHGGDVGLLRPGSPSSGRSSETQSNYENCGPPEYIKMVQNLNKHYDESYLQSKHFHHYFRCKSIVQSYHQWHSKEYFLCDYAINRAETLTRKFLRPDQLAHRSES